MTDADFSPIVLTLKVATVSTLLVMVPGALLAYALGRFEFLGKRVLSILVGLPMVLPPTALGYLLLRLLAEDGLLGEKTLGVDLGILLTWKAAVLAGFVMAFPIVVRTARVTFEEVDPRLELMAQTLGHGRVATFFRYTLPLAYKGLLAAMILGFTRAVGEFGATVIIAGNLPGRTQTLASAIFSAQQVGAEREAMLLLVVAVLVGVVAIGLSEHLGRRPQDSRGR